MRQGAARSIIAAAKSRRGAEQLTIFVGESHRRPRTTSAVREPLISKGSGPAASILRRGPTLVPRRAPPPVGYEPQPTPQRPPNARERRAARDKARRAQKQRTDFSDAAAFAYFMGWPLDMRITVTWGACAEGARHAGHVLGLAAKDRSERLCDALRRELRSRGKPYACIWSRDECMRRGLHDHLAVHWPLPLKDLAWLLARLTGSLPSSGRLPRGVVAQSECGGWQIKCNTAEDEIRSAVDWTTYLRDQGPRHLIMPKIEGKVLGVSRTLEPMAIAPHREALEAWKRQRGWIVEEPADAF